MRPLAFSAGPQRPYRMALSDALSLAGHALWPKAAMTSLPDALLAAMATIRARRSRVRRNVRTAPR